MMNASIIGLILAAVPVTDVALAVLGAYVIAQIALAYATGNLLHLLVEARAHRKAIDDQEGEE